MEPTETSRGLPTIRSEHDAKSIGDASYNTVFERILAKTEGENGLPIVIACAAYYHYKLEKRDWLIAQKKCGPVDQNKLDAYVSTCSDIRIDGYIALARQEVQKFGSDLYEDIYDDINDQIHKDQFAKLYELINQRGVDGATRHTNLRDHITASTGARWPTAIGQNLVASLIWTAIIVIVLASLHYYIDFGAILKSIENQAADKPVATAPPTPEPKSPPAVSSPVQAPSKPPGKR